MRDVGGRAQRRGLWRGGPWCGGSRRDWIGGGVVARACTVWGNGIEMVGWGIRKRAGMASGPNMVARLTTSVVATVSIPRHFCQGYFGDLFTASLFLVICMVCPFDHFYDASGFHNIVCEPSIKIAGPTNSIWA